MLQLPIKLDIENQGKNILPTAKTGVEHNQQFANIIGSLLSAVMVIALILVLLYLVWGAIGWITAGGDSSKVNEARNKMVQAVIGIIVLAATLAIFSFVQYFLGVEALKFQ